MQQALVLLDTIIHTLHHSPPEEEQKQQLVMHDEPSVDCKFLDFDFKTVSKFLHNKLSEISSKKSCRILYVAERSSHVWGSSHPDSDHDVTAIIYFKRRWYYSPFKQMSRQWKEGYGTEDKTRHHHAQKSNLTESKEETSEIDMELTCNELTKTCHEIIKNDPCIFETLNSPLAYYTECPTVLEKLREIVYRTYDWFKLGKHYLSWSVGNYKKIIAPKPSKPSKKNRVDKKPLKTMIYVWRGVLSTEWLLENQTCKGLPLYIPDLIAFTKLLDQEEKNILMSLLIDKVRKSHYALDCEESRKMLERVPEVQDIVHQMMNSADHKSAGKKSSQLRDQQNITEGTSAAQILEELVYEIIESFK